MVESEYGLCGPCWRQLPLITGPVCDSCGIPLLAANESERVQCDDCRKIARPWRRGRAAMRYSDLGRRLVLGLKHSDRQDAAITAATWLAQAAMPLIQEDTLLIPIPLHWRRMLKRRYNQSALLAQHLALRMETGILLDGLQRHVHTKALDGVTVSERFERLSGVISVTPKRSGLIRDRAVLLIDDVMTSGATFAAATEACYAAGARRVDVLALARVCKDA